MAYAAIFSSVMGVFQTAAKTKKATWNSMKGAMGSVKGAAGSLGGLKKVLTFLQPIMKVFNAFLKIIGATVMKTVMPALKPFLDMLTSPIMISIMEDIGEIIGIIVIPILETFTDILEVIAPTIKKVTEYLLENEWILNLLTAALMPTLFILGLLIDNWDAIYAVLKSVGDFIVGVFIGAWDLLVGAFKYVANGFIWFVNAIIDGINTLMNFISFGLWGDIPTIPYLHSGIDFVPRTQPYVLERGERVIKKGGKTGKEEIHVHIDLRNAVVDNVDRLSQKIAEQVLIQIG